MDEENPVMILSLPATNPWLGWQLAREDALWRPVQCPAQTPRCVACGRQIACWEVHEMNYLSLRHRHTDCRPAWLEFWEVGL